MQWHVAHRTDWVRKLREVLVGSKDHGIAILEFCSTLKEKKKVVKSVKY